MAVTIEVRGTGLKKKLISKTAQRRERQVQLAAVEKAVARGERRNDLIPDLRISMRPIAELKGASRRVRKANPEQLERVIASIKACTFVNPILIRGDDIVDGHMRLEAARKLGLAEIPCIQIDHLTEAEARLLAISINKIGESGEWDLAELKIEFEELIELNTDLTITGFSGKEIDIIMLDEEPALDEGEEDIPAISATPVSILEDLWILGRHRILCGNALEAESYAKLLENVPVTAVFTDAPYNVKIANNVSGLGKHKHGEFQMASGEMSRAEFQEFLKTAHAHCAKHLIDGGVAFSCMDWRGIDILLAAARDAGLTMINMAVWNKGGGMGGFYRSAHELVPVFCKGASPAINNIELGRHGRDRTNVWTYPGANRPGTSSAGMLASHPTPKNLDMVVDALLDVTESGSAVLDPFLGSGTTIIAAEKTGRTGYGLELDPTFVDVCVRRWEAATGFDAIHAPTGRTFSDMQNGGREGEDGVA